MDSLKEGSKLVGKKQYLIKNKLGAGGYGITYLAEGTIQDGNIERKVPYTIKEFFMSTCCKREADGSVTCITDKSEMDANKEDFKKEAQHLQQCSHPGIVPVNEIFSANGTIYYVMEYLGENTLARFVESQGGKLSEDYAKEMIKGIACALIALHDNNMTHLDIKPDNVMLVKKDGEFQPVLIDFGLSKHYKASGKVTSNKGAFGVSDGYSPLEQYAGIDYFAPEADVYALAATLVHLLIGHAPKRAAEMSSSYLRQVLDGKASQQTIDAIVNAMQKNNEDRTQSIKSFCAALGISTNSGGNSGSTVPIKKRRQNSNKMMYVIGGIAAAALVAAAIIVCPKMCTDNHPEQPEINDTTKVDTAANNIETQNGKDEEEINNTSTENNSEETDVTADVKNNSTTENANAANHNTNAASAQSQPTQPQTPPTVTASPAKVNTPQPAPTSGTLNLGYATWVGGIKNGKPNGQGTMTFHSRHIIDSMDPDAHYAEPGEKVSGTYSNGHLDNGRLMKNDGSTEGIFIGG